MKKKLFLLIVCSSYFSLSFGQDLGQIGKAKLFNLTGGISANAIYYEGDANRDPFTYFVNGNVNINISGVYNIPLSFSYSNQEFNYSNPFSFNRLSIHPSYKWVATHIGDVNMTFSPYTLSGHQFTGFGFDLTPEGPFKISAMYGRLLKATEFNPDEPDAIAAYDRFGFGLKSSYQFEKWQIGLIFFKAKDNENSIDNPFPASLELTPKDNMVASLETNISLFDKAQIRAEYALSGVTEDIRVQDERQDKGAFSFLLDENITTNYYNAFNLALTYPAGNGTIGASYERVDPEYRTFGAYFFNNDLENITANASQTIFNNKLNIAINAGLQRDNLDNTKSSELQRIVSAINLNLTASEKVGITGSYSNFQSYTNIRDQFDFINEVGQLDNVDTLNYRQITQNANLGINYAIKKTETRQHTTNFNLVYQNSKNLQDDTEIENGTNDFYNGTAAYTIGYPKRFLNISLAANTSYNTIGEDENLTFGPTLSIGKQFFDKKLRANFSSSYNASYTNGEQQNSIFNFRLGGNYIWLEQHNFSLNLLTLLRNTELNNSTDFTATFGYSYSFDGFKLKLRKRKRIAEEKQAKQPKNILSFRYRNVTYSGTPEQISQQLTNVFESSQFADIPSHKRKGLSELLELVKQQKSKNKYKESALNFLKELYSFNDFKKVYDEALYQAISKVKRDMSYIDFKLEKSFVKTKVELDNLKQESSSNQEKIKEVEKELEERQRRLVGHRWMQKQFRKLRSEDVVTIPKGFLKEFKEKQVDKTYQIFEAEQDIMKIEVYLEAQIIDFYYKKSLDLVDPNTFELRYIIKN
ncbi:hypothetical protein M0D21_22685 [Aquimarina sp. D1M17]|uniref:hypothetical protein n=1 Tax=Aquimarina acroporae TaxID=2937283 RepID=UPI0020BFB5D9|nr:hypothetical protein [Aquimarina acroporae]MCK8524403.1 hypothetical protein [Aquimarina acroporae]